MLLPSLNKVFTYLLTDIWARASNLLSILGLTSRLLDQFLEKKKRKKKRINFVRVCRFPILAFCMDKHIFGGIVFYKHISSCFFFFFFVNLYTWM